MPIHNSRDKKGSYFQWGSSGKKYHYAPNNKRAKTQAKSKATSQGQAIKTSEGKY